MKLHSPHLLAVALCCAWAVSGCWEWRDDERRSVVLITIDTLRADHLDVYGYERPTSPEMARLAARGVLYEYALSQAPWTLPAMASIHTSLYPFEHGATRADKRLRGSFVTLAEVLREEGYHTMGLASHIFVSRRYGMGQGFIDFDQSQVRGHEAVTSEALSELAASRLERAPRPFFLWVHYFDPHNSYVRHPEYGFAASPGPNRITAAQLERAEQDRDGSGGLDPVRVATIYDEEIAHTDRFVGELIGHVDSLGLGEEVVFILTADHGEYFMERGRFLHDRDVYDELVRVPLMIAGAIPSELRGRVFSEPVETRSIPATVMAIAGIDPHPFDGRDLLLAAATGRAAPYVFTEGLAAWTGRHRKRAVVGHGWKLIHRLDDDTSELYDLRRDPREQNDLFGRPDPEIARIQAELSRELERYAAGKPHEAPRVELSEEEEEHLKALGYAR